ncbi:MAG: hypothetical protein ABIB61_01530 [Candidatus Shapirobacteria bacterium]
MTEYQDPSGIEQQTLFMASRINESLEDIFGGRIAPIKDSSIKWISREEAGQLSPRRAGDSMSPVFTRASDIFFVKDLVLEELGIRKDWPPPLNDPNLYIARALAHEQIHAFCERVDGGEVTKDVAMISWEAVYGDMVTSSGDEVSEEIKDYYREINKALEAEGEKVRTAVNGTVLSIGSREQILFQFGHQTDEDLVDFLSVLAVQDFVKKFIKTSPKEDEQILYLSFISAGKNRQSNKPEDVINLYSTLRAFFFSSQRDRFFDFYFSGQFYEEYAKTMNRRDRIYFACRLALGITDQSLEMIMTGETLPPK